LSAKIDRGRVPITYLYLKAAEAKRYHLFAQKYQ
jgi:hypothetical protein